MQTGARIALVLSVLLLARPAAAQFDFSGEWVTPRAVIPGQQLTQQFEDGPDRADGPEVGDYTGLPINDFARKKAEAWSASVIAQPERQGNPHPAQYSVRSAAARTCASRRWWTR